MAGTEDFYEGANYGLDSSYGIDSMNYGTFGGYRVDSMNLGFPADPTTANQIKSTSDKISSGTNVVEVSAANIALPGGPMGLMDAMPKQMWKEINRLKKLTGVDLTFHGPLVESTGISRQGWEDTQRQQAEREMFRAMQRAHELEPTKNIPVVFHSSNIGVDPETRVVNEKTGKEEITQISVIDERTGQIQQGIGPATIDYLSKNPNVDPLKAVEMDLDKRNSEAWTRALQNTNFQSNQGWKNAERNIQGFAARSGAISPQDIDNQKKVLLNTYKEYVKDPEKFDQTLKQYATPEEAQDQKEIMMDITNSDLYIRDGYQGFQGLFNQAYDYYTNREPDAKSKKLLDDFRTKFVEKVDDYTNDPSKIVEFGQAVNEGINMLRKLDAPKSLKPMKEFMIDKASDTFSGVAYKSYKEFGDKSPVVAIENPPADRFPLSRANEIVQVIQKAREKFVKNAVDDGMSRSAAKSRAEKLIGATWDTAHINLIKGKGYNKKDILKEVEQIAPYVKHIHISDNFGLGDTELPPGMGNAPIAESLKIIEKYNSDLKKVVETGSWFSALKFRGTPINETLTSLGSPVYAMQQGPYWNQVAAMSSGYFGGVGDNNPEFHHSLYGAGFSNLPIELGGSMGGRSRMGGAPLQ